MMVVSKRVMETAPGLLVRDWLVKGEEGRA